MIKEQLALKIIFGIGLAGFLFSGYLSYKEIFETCAAGCPVIAPGSTVFGYPACVYGFLMYLAILIVAGCALMKRRAMGHRP